MHLGARHSWPEQQLRARALLASSVISSACPDDEDAPSLLVERVEVVDLEGHDGVAHRGVETGPSGRAEDDVAVERWRS